MRYKTYKRGGYSQGVVGETGGDIGGVTTLFRDPIADLEAATKNYVDQYINNINANQFTTGILPVSALPEFGGDLVKPAGTNQIFLRNTPVSPGEYTKITVNAKGLVTGGGYLTADDIPTLPFSKITTGKPTTLAGYGITNAMSTGASVMSGPLKIGTITTDENSAVTKGFVDSLSGSSAIAVGTKILRPAGASQAGLLRANGALVSKADYPELYSAIGDQFSFDWHDGHGQPWIQQEAFGGDTWERELVWELAGNLPATNSRFGFAMTKNRLFIIGGGPQNGPINTVRTAPINIDGSIGTWTTSANLPVSGVYSKCFVFANRLYVITPSFPVSYTTPRSTVYYANINSDGTLGSWVAGPIFGGNLNNRSVVLVGNRFYIFTSGTTTMSDYDNRVHGSTINETNGTMSAWAAVGTVPGPILDGSQFFTRNRMYGVVTTLGVNPQLYSSVIDSNGLFVGFEKISDDFLLWPYPIVTGDSVHFINGLDPNKPNDTYTYKAKINADGTIGDLTRSSVKPFHRFIGAHFRAGNYIYYIGGEDGSGTPKSEIYRARFAPGITDFSPKYSPTQPNRTPSDKFKLPDIPAPTYDLEVYVKF